MEALSLEQEQALALARARRRRAEAAGAPVATTPPPGAQTPVPAPFERAGGHGPSMAGVADAGVRGFIGLKQAAAMLNPGYAFHRKATGADTEDQAILREQETEAKNEPEKGKRLLGNVGGNLALAVAPSGPAGLVSSAARTALPKALGFLSPAAGGAAASGLQGAALNPGHGDTDSDQAVDKLKSAGVDAATGGVLSSALAAIRRGATGMFTPSKEAADLMKQGVNPTLQQGAESWIGRFIGGLTSGAVDVNKRQNAEIMDALLTRIAPKVDLKNATIPEKVGMLKSHFNDKGGEFDQLLGGKVFTLTNQARDAVWAAARGGRGQQPEAVQGAMGAMSHTGSAMQSQNPVNMKSGKLREYQELLQDAVNKFDPQSGVINKQAHAALTTARNKFNDLVRDPKLTAEERQALQAVEERYGDFLRFASAAERAPFHANPSVRDINNSYARMASGDDFATGASATQRELLEPATRVMGLAPSQEQSRSLVTAGKRIGKGLITGGVGAGAVAGNPVATALAPVYGISLVGQTGAGARFLFGQGDKQKYMAELLRGLQDRTAGAGQVFQGD